MSVASEYLSLSATTAQHRYHDGILEASSAPPWISLIDVEKFQ
jgi:hypothetical protein